MSRLIGRTTIIAVGKLRHKPWQNAQQDYLSRLQRYTHLRLVEVKDVLGRGQPDAVSVQKESSALLKAAADIPYTIAMSSEGQELTSIQFANFVQRNIELYGHIAFLIGGPLGFDKHVTAQCSTTLSLSRLTFPHEIARLLLLEQLYRAATILRGEKYHK